MGYADTLLLPLRRPINVGSLEFTELQLSEPTVKQLVQASKASTPLEQTATLIHLVAKVPVAVVDQMTQRDYAAAADFFAHFSEEPKDSTTAPSAP